MRRHAVESVGSLLLVFTVVCCVRGEAPLTPLAVGAVLAALVYAGGHVSGAHYNPAVTLASAVRGALPARDVPGYVLAQLAGGTAGGLLGRVVVPRTAVTPLTLTGGRVAPALVAELVVTFALAWVVLHVATSADHPGNSFYGLAIGATVLAGAVAVGGVSGGAFNPAVGLGACVGGLASWSALWVSVVADLAAGVLAALAFRAVERPAPAAVDAVARDADGVPAAVPAPRPAADAVTPAPAASPVAG